MILPILPWPERKTISVLFCFVPHRAKFRVQQSICESAIERTGNAYTYLSIYSASACMFVQYAHTQSMHRHSYLSLRIDALVGKQQICFARESQGDINCRACYFLPPEWYAWCQVGVSLFLSESYYTNQLLIQLIMKNMQKNISRS